MPSHTSLAIDVSSVPPSPAGAGRYAIELVSHLSRLSSHFDLITKGGDASFWREVSSNKVLFDAPSNRGLRIAWEQVVLPLRLNSRSVGIYHGIHYTIPRGFKGRSVSTVHDTTMIEHPEWHERVKVEYFSRAISFAVKNADAIIVPSEFTKMRLEQCYGSLDKVVVIHHGVDHGRFKPKSHNDSVSEGEEILSVLPARYVLHIGTIEPRKNIESLISAFDILASRDLDISLVLVGQKGWKSGPIFSRVLASKFKERIKIFGYLSERDLLVTLQNALCVAYPSFAEGFGLPVLEAMATGIPVVTSSGSVMEEVSGEYGWLCNPYDSEDIARSIENAISDRNDVVAKTERAIHWSRRFDWANTALSHLNVYKSLGFDPKASMNL